MMNHKVIGVDMGGTKIRAGLLSGTRLIKESTKETPAKKSEKVVIDCLIQTIEKVIDPDSIGIGIGVPGLVDAKKGIVYDVTFIPSWKEVHLKEILENYFKIPVFVNNDSNCFALGEKFFGKGIHCSNFVAVTLGTGLGSGIIIENRLYSGTYTGAGEFGCISYKNSTIEDHCASGFFTRMGTNGEDLYLAAKNGDPKALAAFSTYGNNLSEAVKIILYTCDPEMIILGGSISNAWEFFIDSLWKGLEDYMFPVVLKTLKIEKSTLKDSAIFGAVGLVYNYS